VDYFVVQKLEVKVPSHEHTSKSVRAA